MKKTLIALTLIVTFAASSFAGVSFLIAPGVGTGKVALLGMYATNHVGNVANSENSAGNTDATSLGLRAAYGIMEDLDVLVAYSQDTLVNVKNVGPSINAAVDSKQLSGTTSGIGLKYTVLKGNNTPVDVAVLVGVESSMTQIRLSATGYSADLGMGVNTMALACIFSKQMGNVIPYGGIALKSLNQPATRIPALMTFDQINGQSLGFNLGICVALAANQAVMAEINSEVRAWGSYKVNNAVDKHDNASADNVSGLSLGYVYMF